MNEGRTKTYREAIEDLSRSYRRLIEKLSKTYREAIEDLSRTNEDFRLNPCRFGIIIVFLWSKKAKRLPMNIEEVRDFTLSLYGVTEDQPFGDDNITFRVEGKIFLCLWLGGGKYNIEETMLRFACKRSPERGTARTILCHHASLPLEQNALERRFLRTVGNRICQDNNKRVIQRDCQ